MATPRRRRGYVYAYQLPPAAAYAGLLLPAVHGGAVPTVRGGGAAPPDEASVGRPARARGMELERRHLGRGRALPLAIRGVRRGRPRQEARPRQH
jgi:hypothetical protein